MKKLFERVNKIVVDGRWYYDIGEHQFATLNEISHQFTDIQPAIEQSLQMNHWYGVYFLVPLDVIERIRYK